MKKKNLIIFEGPDRVSKSTQVLRLFRYMNFNKSHTNMIHNSLFPLPDILTPWKKMEAYQQYYEKQANLLSPLQNYIFDRSHIGEYIYGQLYRNYKNEKIFNAVEVLLKENFTVFLIVLLDDAESLVKREDGNSLSSKIDLKQEELRLFIKAYELTTIKNKALINVNFDNNTIDQVHEKVVSFIQSCYF